jgi:hypothetical protein
MRHTPSSPAPDVNPHNLVNRSHIEQALNPGPWGVPLEAMISVSELICHTEVITMDLLYASAPRRVSELLSHGLAEVVTLDGKTPAKINPAFASTILSEEALQRAASTARFRLTEEGMSVVKHALTLPYQNPESLDRIAFQFDRDRAVASADAVVEDAEATGDRHRRERAALERDFVAKQANDRADKLSDLADRFEQERRAEP